jgi:hypothetical protein
VERGIICKFLLRGEKYSVGEDEMRLSSQIETREIKGINTNC